jgi:asparagine N-glycosylation enzyme membrane subunit Stt3
MRQEMEQVEQQARDLLHAAAARMRKPTVGALIAGAAVLAAGAVWGASEAAVAAVAAYAVFRMLRKRNRAEPEERASSPA